MAWEPPDRGEGVVRSLAGHARAAALSYPRAMAVLKMFVPVFGDVCGVRVCAPLSPRAARGCRVVPLRTIAEYLTLTRRDGRSGTEVTAVERVVTPPN